MIKLLNGSEALPRPPQIAPRPCEKLIGQAGDLGRVPAKGGVP